MGKDCETALKTVNDAVTVVLALSRDLALGRCKFTECLAKDFAVLRDVSFALELPLVRYNLMSDKARSVIEDFANDARDELVRPSAKTVLCSQGLGNSVSEKEAFCQLKAFSSAGNAFGLACELAAFI